MLRLADQNWVTKLDKINIQGHLIGNLSAFSTAFVQNEVSAGTHKNTLHSCTAFLKC